MCLSEGAFDGVKKANGVEKTEKRVKKEGSAGGEDEGVKEEASKALKTEEGDKEMMDKKTVRESPTFAEPEAVSKLAGEKYTPKVRLGLDYFIHFVLQYAG